MREFKCDDDTLLDSVIILAIDDEERSKHALRLFGMSKKKGNAALLLSYGGNHTDHVSEVQSILKTREVAVIKGVPSSQYEFVEELSKHQSILMASKIVIDISCILTPYLFLLMKYIHMWNENADLYAINTIPYDYYYPHTPFTSYRSYYGDLKMEEIFGFSSSYGLREEKDLFIFSGFEGALALKVEEDTAYKQLYIVNALPSYQQKYKDISTINNYQLIVSNSCKRLYASSINPFETYNILDKYINTDSGASIAPLCTKPIALGICMYAMKHENIRIVYPFSNYYELGRSHHVYKSYIYKVE